MVSQLSFCWVNEFIPIFNDFNSFNPSILNRFTEQKQSLPIINSSNLVNREILKIVYSESLQFPLEMEIDLILKSVNRISLGGTSIKWDKFWLTSI